MINKGNINEIYLTLCERLESTQLCSFIILVGLVFRYPVDIMQTIYHIWLLFLLHLVKRSLTLVSWFASSNVISLYPSLILYSLYDFFFDIFFSANRSDFDVLFIGLEMIMSPTGGWLICSGELSRMSITMDARGKIQSDVKTCYHLQIA